MSLASVVSFAQTWNPVCRCDAADVAAKVLGGSGNDRRVEVAELITRLKISKGCFSPSQDGRVAATNVTGQQVAGVKKQSLSFDVRLVAGTITRSLKALAQTGSHERGGGDAFENVDKPRSVNGLEETVRGSRIVCQNVEALIWATREQ
jgi:hypothetical protein